MSREELNLQRSKATRVSTIFEFGCCVLLSRRIRPEPYLNKVL